MLDTLYKFGRQLSQDASREEFDDVIATPPVDDKDKAKGVNFFVVEIIFDLDENKFRFGKLRPFSETDKTYEFSPYNLRCIKIQGGNNKSIYLTADPRKSFDPWKKTFFGKVDEKKGAMPKQAELTEAIQKDFPDLTNTLLFRATEQIFKLRDVFEAAFPEWKKMTEALNLDEKNRVAMIFASIIWKEQGISEAKPVAHLDGYDDFIRRKFLHKGTVGFSGEGKTAAKPKLCYVTGEMREDVSEPAFDNRYSMNKMFVTTTKNYAAGFEDKDFSKNYQVGSEAQVLLERGSAHLLKNYTVRIAGVDHCIVPQFRTGRDIDLDNLTTQLKTKSELLFTMTDQWKNYLSDLRYNAEGEIYWINFLGYESDGNFFKTINIIKDVSKTHFETVLQVLRKAHTEMSEMEGVNWFDVMTYGKERKLFDFNFYTIYSLIPVRKEKEKRNAALALFKAILERRPISSEALFGHFAELMQCHRYERYAGYNILPHSNFDFATRDAIFQYHAFFQFLKKIKLLDMEEKTTLTTATLEEKNAAVNAFFERMGYTDDQRAAFYLGRILGSVGRAQWEKGHKTKPVLGKVNYNGMDAGDLKRLHADLFEKCKQYDILSYNEGGFSKFTDLFKDEQQDKWDKRMKPDESLFYLLSGYSFRTPKEATEEPENPTTETDN